MPQSTSPITFCLFRKPNFWITSMLSRYCLKKKEMLLFLSTAVELSLLPNNQTTERTGDGQALVSRRVNFLFWFDSLRSSAKYLYSPAPLSCYIFVSVSLTLLHLSFVFVVRKQKRREGFFSQILLSCASFRVFLTMQIDISILLYGKSVPLAKCILISL